MGALFCVLAVLTDPEIPDKGRLIGKRSALIAGLCLLLAGWFFIRSAFLHDGDLLGIATEKRFREALRSQGYVLYDYNCLRSEGLSIIQFLRLRRFEWITATVKSFIGTFGYMSIRLPRTQYGLYFAAIGLGILLFLAVLTHRRPDRRDHLILCYMLLASAVTVALHFWQSYARDYQPQGRYIISTTPFIGFMIAYGMDKTTLTVRRPGEGESAALHPAAAFTLIWLALFAWACLWTMTKMLR